MQNRYHEKERDRERERERSRQRDIDKEREKMCVTKKEKRERESLIEGEEGERDLFEFFLRRASLPVFCWIRITISHSEQHNPTRNCMKT